jgi:hypothetical protein
MEEICNGLSIATSKDNVNYLLVMVCVGKLGPHLVRLGFKVAETNFQREKRRSF